MLDLFREHLSSTEFIPEGSRVLVGYSGGADSTALLHLLHRAGIDVVAGHLHHGQRAEADEEEQNCAAVCDRLGIPFVSGKADVPSMSKLLKIGIEEAGRKARYEFFRQAAFSLQCSLVATGHTKDDHVETVLLNITRGSGLEGLAGIRAKRDNIVRPLLTFTRAETRGYCEENRLWFHDDPGNKDIDFARVRIRLKVLPELKMINPAVDDAIERLAEIAADENDTLNAGAARVLEAAELKPNGHLSFLTEDCELVLDSNTLRHIPKSILRRAVRLAAEVLGADPLFHQIDGVVDMLSNGRAGAISFEGGLVVAEVAPNNLTLRQLEPARPFRFPLTVPGETISDDFGWAFQAEEATAEVEVRRAEMETRVEPAKLRGNLYFRSFEDGDKIQPLGFEGTRKLSDLLGEAKLTEAARKRLPIVCDMAGPIWVPGVCLSERVRPEVGSRRALRLSLGPTGPERNVGEPASVR